MAEPLDCRQCRHSSGKHTLSDGRVLLKCAVWHHTEVSPEAAENVRVSHLHPDPSYMHMPDGKPADESTKGWMCYEPFVQVPEQSMGHQHRWTWDSEDQEFYCMETVACGARVPRSDWDEFWGKPCASAMADMILNWLWSRKKGGDNVRTGSGAEPANQLDTSDQVAGG